MKRREKYREGEGGKGREGRVGKKREKGGWRGMEERGNGGGGN